MISELTSMSFKNLFSILFLTSIADYIELRFEGGKYIMFSGVFMLVVTVKSSFNLGTPAVDYLAVESPAE